MSSGTAIQHLQAAPHLVDLEEWTQWGVACEPTLGRLRDFLTQHGGSIHCCVPLLCIADVSKARSFGVEPTGKPVSQETGSARADGACCDKFAC